MREYTHLERTVEAGDKAYVIYGSEIKLALVERIVTKEFANQSIYKTYTLKHFSGSPHSQHPDFSSTKVFKTKQQLADYILSIKD